MMIGSYAWSCILTGTSTATSEDTHCSNCSFTLSDISMLNSSARTSTSGNLFTLTVMSLLKYFYLFGGRRIPNPSIFTC